MAVPFRIKKSTSTTAAAMANTTTYPIVPGTIYFTSDHYLIYDYENGRAVINCNRADISTAGYGVCSTGGSTAAKTVTVVGDYKLQTGATAMVRFSNTNTVVNSTLNINNTGAKDIYYNGNKIPAYYLVANRTYIFVYDGSVYQCVTDINTDGSVTQNAVTISNITFPLLLGYDARTTAVTGSVNKSADLTYNPSTQLLSAPRITVSGSATFNGSTSIDDATVGNLIVNGAARFNSISTSVTPAANSNDTSIATTAFVYNAFRTNDAMVFKGVINSNSDLPATHYQGWVYKVGTAGTYAGQTCEINDTIYCVTDGTTANNSHWVVVQNNIDTFPWSRISGKPNLVQVYSRTDVGTSPNYDNPGFNGYFEIRGSNETTGETGNKPFNAYAGFLTLNTGVAIMQLTGTNAVGFHIRGKQSSQVTLADVPWQRIVTETSGQWAISISGNAVTATSASYATDANYARAASSASYATTAGTLSSLNTADSASVVNVWRKVWISYSDGTSGRPAVTEDLAYNTSSKILKTPHFLATHISGGAAEYRVQYSSTVDMWFGIGNGDINHGIYDEKAGKWMICADGSGNVYVNGQATTAVTATNANKVVQNASNTNNVAYRLLLSGTATDNSETTALNKANHLQYNPSQNRLATGNLTLTGEIDVSGNAYLRNASYIDNATIGTLLVNGSARFVQSPIAPTPATSSNDTTVATTAFVKAALTVGSVASASYATSASLASNANSLTNTRTIWGQNFNGTANVSGAMTDVGPDLKLPGSNTAFQFLTSASAAAYGKFGKLLLSDNYSQGDFSTYRLYVNGGTSYIGNALIVNTGTSHYGVKLGNTYVNAISNDIIFQNNNAIRFGGDSWDYNVWAGLKYTHSTKTIYLGLADGTIFTCNSKQASGTMAFPGINKIFLGTNTAFKCGTHIYPFIGAAARSQWYKITFPFSTATTTDSAKWFMLSFDLHFGGGYNNNPSGVAHVTFYWLRAASNGAWTMPQGHAFIEGAYNGSIGLYYRIAEPGILYVNNAANIYNGIWIDNLFTDDTGATLDWADTKIETCSAITLANYTALTSGRISMDRNGGLFSTHLCPWSDNVQTLGSSTSRWKTVYGVDFYGAFNGNATTASYPLGFAQRSTTASWGDQTGTTITVWDEAAGGGSIEFRRNNPSTGKMSIKVDGRFYGNEGANPAMLMSSDGSYWGMGGPDGQNNIWIRTTSQGIIPNQNGGRTAGHAYLGTDTWYFGWGYITNIYSSLIDTTSLVVNNKITAASLQVNGAAAFNGSTTADDLTVGNMIVNGSSHFNTIPTSITPAANSNDTSIATTEFVYNAFRSNDAMVFKGVVNSNSDLPATHYQGWTYKVGTAGTYAGQTCEIGDTIYCVTDGTTANNSHWVVVQNNIDILPVARGGTGATTAAAARANLGTWSFVNDSYPTIMPADGTTNNWVKIGTSNSSYGLLPSRSGSSGSGHNYIGTSSWYWYASYIDNIYGSVIRLNQVAATDPSTSSNARIEFAYTSAGDQPVSIAYTANDTYRAPAGLKILGGTGATPAWLEVEGNIYTPLVVGTTTSANCLTESHLTTQEAIDDFLGASQFKAATFKTTEENNVGFASNDGMLISMGWTGATYGAQLAIDDNVAGRIKFRAKSKSWGNWHTIAHSNNITANNPTLAWNTESTVATIAGVAIKVKLPANPNTNTDTLVKQTLKSDNVEYKILNTVSASPTSGAAAEAAYGADFTINPSAKTLTAPTFKVTSNATITYNTANGCLEITV